MAEAWCPQQKWQVRLVRANSEQRGCQHHSPDFRELVAANWFDARNLIPERVARDNMVIFLFGGAMPEGSEVTEIVVAGPAATQQRDASQERARSWNFIPRVLKKKSN